MGLSVRTALLCAVFLVAGARPAPAGINVWTSNGPPGGVINALAIDPLTPSTLYAGTNYVDGVFKSTDAGATWAAVNAGLPEYRVVNALAIDPLTPRTLYAGGLDVFKSTDGAVSWQAVDFPGLPVFDPATPTTLYAVAGGVFKSRDAGGSWSALNSGLTNAEVSALAIDPKTPTRLYAVAGGGVLAIDQVSTCVGDCNDASTVTIDELLAMVNIALGTAAVSECLAGDGDQNGAITVDEILTAVNNALSRCG